MIRIDKSRVLADFEAAHDLICLMGAWDVRESAGFGVSESDVLSNYYNYTATSLMAKFLIEDAELLVARWEGVAAGCAGFSRSGEGIAEIQKMFVRPDMRGKGIGKALMATLIQGMRQKNYVKARLETLLFMDGAIALYGAFGFSRCEPFRSPPEKLVPITIFMETAL